MHVIWHQNEVSGTVPLGSNSLVRRPHSGCFLLGNMQPFARSGRWGWWGFKSRLLPPSRSAPIGVNCIPFEMGEVCLALQRDLQPPTHPPVSFFLLHFVAHRSRIRVVLAAAADYFFGFRLPIGCLGGVDRFCCKASGRKVEE